MSQFHNELKGKNEHLYRRAKNQIISSRSFNSYYRSHYEKDKYKYKQPLFYSKNDRRKRPKVKFVTVSSKKSQKLHLLS